MNLDLNQKINELGKLDFQLFEQDFFVTWQKTVDELRAVLLVSEILQDMYRRNIAFRIFDSGMAVSIFRDKSTRTRFSFASAVNALGLALQDLEESKTQISHGETIRETANMISFLTEVIGIRDDMFIGEGDRYQREVAAAVDFGFKQDILPQRPVIINLQSDVDHPTQSLADLSKMINFFGSLANIRGKKIAMTWAYSPSYGKPLSVAQGMIGLLTRFGADVVLAHPPGYDLLPTVTDIASKQAEHSEGNFIITDSMAEAFQEADVVCPKSWASFRVMEERRDLLHAGDLAGLEDLERKCLAENSRYRDWECNADMMKLTKNALYMHPLPADVSQLNCEFGEVSREIFDASLFHTYTQAGYKPFIIAAIIFLSKIHNPQEKLISLLSNPVPRKNTDISED